MQKCHWQFVIASSTALTRIKDNGIGRGGQVHSQFTTPPRELETDDPLMSDIITQSDIIMVN